MLTILSADAYRGFSAPYEISAQGAQPSFIGRILWPDSVEPEEAFIKLYQTSTCGTANEAIGYAANELRGVKQPRKGAILLLSQRELPELNIATADFVDAESGLTACWATTLEPEAKPFRFIRKLSSFSQKQAIAFYRSTFCHRLAVVDHVTGNNDRHEGNFLYLDDLDYLAIDQGCVGGGLYWHKMFPDNTAKNEIVALAQQNLVDSQLGEWRGRAMMEYQREHTRWSAFLVRLQVELFGLLADDEIESIVTYMEDRANGPNFAKSCERLI